MRIVPAPKRAKTQSDLPVCTARHAVDLPYFHGHNGTTVWARRLDDFANRAHGCVVPQPDLRLDNLTTDGLHRLKLPKAELIASAAIDYLATARWAEAIHHQHPDADGLVWMSRQRDRDHALMLFGDRADKALAGTRMGSALSSNDVLRQSVLALALRVGIDAS